MGQDGHSAFPGLARAPGGRLTLVWRRGSDHAAARDGRIELAESAGPARPFGAPRVVAGGDGLDYRDPSVSYAGGHRWLTYFTGARGRPAQGAFARRARRPAVRIDSLAYAAITAPIVELPGGDLGAVYYGRARAEPTTSIWFARSTDGGTRWTSTRIAAGRAYSEPWLVVRGATLQVLHRWGRWDAIGITSSADGGRTWTAPRRILADATGRPATVVFRSGVMAVIYRSTADRSAMLAASTDHGATWTVTGTLMAAPAGSPLGMTYAAAQEVRPGVARVVFGMENADGSSRLYGADVRTR